MNHESKSEIYVFGKASQKIIKIIQIPNKFPNDMSLMEFLIDNDITIASSCNGVGSCHKCLVNISLLSCQITLKTYLEQTPLPQIQISYL